MPSWHCHGSHFLILPHFLSGKGIKDPDDEVTAACDCIGESNNEDDLEKGDGKDSEEQIERKKSFEPVTFKRPDSLKKGFPLLILDDFEQIEYRSELHNVTDMTDISV